MFIALLPASRVLAHGLGRGRAWRASVVGVALVACIPLARPTIATALSRRELVTEPDDADTRMLVQSLKERPPRGRLLVEDAGPDFGGQRFGSTYLLGYLPDLLHAELIGGPHPSTLAPTGRTNFVAGTLLGHEIADLPEASLRAVLHDFNIATVVAWSAASQRRFDALRLDRSRIGAFHVYRVPNPPGFATSGTASARPDVITVVGAVADGTVLRWHYDPRMRVEPALPIEEVVLPYIRPGLIRVRNGAVRDFNVFFQP
jgi:hypothetical protein